MDYKKVVEERLKNQNFVNEMGLVVEEASEDEVVFSFKNDPKFHQMKGYLHGGIVAAALDTAAGFSASPVVKEGEYVLTVELKINYLRPATSDKFYVVGRKIREGRTLITVESELYSDEKKLLAKALGTMIKISE